MSSAIYVSVIVVATAGLVYELLAAAAASYLLGDSITQFSTVIGAYLFAMGIGAVLSPFVRPGRAARFAALPAAAGPAAGADPHLAADGSRQRRRRSLVDVDLPVRAGAAGAPARARRRHGADAGRRHRGRRADHGVVGGAPVRR